VLVLEVLSHLSDAVSTPIRHRIPPGLLFRSSDTTIELLNGIDMDPHQATKNPLPVSSEVQQNASESEQVLLGVQQVAHKPAPIQGAERSAWPNPASRWPHPCVTDSEDSEYTTSPSLRADKTLGSSDNQLSPSSAPSPFKPWGADDDDDDDFKVGNQAGDDDEKEDVGDEEERGEGDEDDITDRAVANAYAQQNLELTRTSHVRAQRIDFAVWERAA